MLTRNDEVRYHNLTTYDKSSYLVEKYLTPQNLPNLYFIYTPNPKELTNNIAWRLVSDIVLEHNFKGIEDPLTKEPAYAVAGLLPSFTAAYLGLNIGSSDNKFTYTHFLYTVLRSLGKATPLFLADETKRMTKGALDYDVKIALYATDMPLRWMTYGNERLQSDNSTDIFSSKFIITSFISGASRIYGADKAQPLAKKVQEITGTTIFYLSSATMITAFGTNILKETSTFDKITALTSITKYNVNLLIEPAVTKIAPYLEYIPTEKLTNLIQPAYTTFKALTPDSNTVYNYIIIPIFSAVNIYLTAFSNTASFLSTNILAPTTNLFISGSSTIITMITDTIPVNEYLITPVTEYIIMPITEYTSVISTPPYASRISLIIYNRIIDPVNNQQNYHNLKDTMNKGGLFLVCSISFDTIKFVATNIVGGLILQPISRIFGAFSEELSEFLSNISEDLTTILMGDKTKPNYLNDYDDSFLGEQSLTEKNDDEF